jgi:hypothetical protein
MFYIKENGESILEAKQFASLTSNLCAFSTLPHLTTWLEIANSNSTPHTCNTSHSMMASAVEQKLADMAINNSRDPQVKLGSGPNGEFLEPGTCDNFNSSGKCGKKGGKYCKNCHLVQVRTTIDSTSHD